MVLPREQNDNGAYEHRDTKHNQRNDELRAADRVIDDAENRRENEHADGVESPLMADISTADGSLSRCYDDGNIEEHVNDNWKDFGDDADRVVRVVRHFVIDDDSALLENAPLAVRIFDEALDGWRTQRGVLSYAQQLHPIDLRLGNVAAELF